MTPSLAYSNVEIPLIPTFGHILALFNMQRFPFHRELMFVLFSIGPHRVSIENLSSGIIKG